MSGKDDAGATRRGVRLVVLILAALVISNVVAALLFERDRGLGADELVVTAVGVGLPLFVEFLVFRRRRR